MTQQKKGFLLYLDSLCILEELTDEQAGKLIKTIHYYQSKKELPENLDQIIKLIVIPFIKQFERDEDKYQNIINRNRANGSKGGRPKKPNGLLGNPEEPKKADKDKDNDNDKDKDKKTKAKKYNDFHFSIASELGNFVKNHYKKNLTMANIKKWADDIRLLQEDLSPRKNSEEDIKKAMKSIIENTGKPYFVSVQSGTAFRKKFFSIEEYSKRENKQSKPPININTKEIDYGTSGKF
jgi:hypothetical protein